jgi:phosphoribosylamine--glycine ligase
MKRILVIGAGGVSTPSCGAIRNTTPAPVQLFCAPGNAGIGQLAQLVNISVNDHEALVQFVEANMSI